MSKFLALPDLKVRYKVRSSQTIYNWMNTRGFPRPVSPAPGSSLRRWPEHVLDEHDRRQLAAASTHSPK